MSRFTVPFLQHCRENNIHVLCYPSHSTHVYQGLDVACFGPLKKSYSKARIAFQKKTGQKINKDNFIQLYSIAHADILVPSTILSAFKETGVYPYNPDAISPMLLKPSIESSCTGSGLPLPQSSPVRVVAALIQNITGSQASKTSPPDFSPPIDPVLLAESAVAQLGGTSAAYLMSRSPVKAAAAVPKYSHPGLPADDVDLMSQLKGLLEKVPETDDELQLQNALHVTLRHSEKQRGTIIGMQSALVLQETYCQRLRGQLAAKEVGERRAGFLNNGVPRLITGDTFYKLVKQYFRDKDAKVAAAELKRVLREGHARDIEEWKQLEVARKERNNKRRAEYKIELAAWQCERDSAKAEKRKPQWKKPVQGKLEPVIKKPSPPESLQQVDGGVSVVSSIVLEQEGEYFSEVFDESWTDKE